MITGNELAFPFIETSNGQTSVSIGLTIRQHFAAMAMQGLCANNIPGPHHKPDFIALEAVQLADALIKELNKQS